jgi:hypothetical protein
MDVAPWFPIQAGNKENRFQRAVYFYGRNRKVMADLDRFLVSRRNADVTLGERGERGEAGSSAGPIGGIRIVAASKPIPDPGGPVSRYRPEPLSAYPPERVRTLYQTPERLRWKRCRELP